MAEIDPPEYDRGSLVGQADPLGVLGVELVAEDEQLGGPGQPDEAGSR